MATNWLPLIVPAIAKHEEQISELVRTRISDLRPLLASLRDVVQATPGLEHCEEQIGAVLDGSTPAGAVLVGLLSTLAALPVEAQVSFVQTLLSFLEKPLREMHTNLWAVAHEEKPKDGKEMEGPSAKEKEAKEKVETKRNEASMDALEAAKEEAQEKAAVE